MKAVRYERPWMVNLIDIPEPQESDLAIIRVHAVGICGSDINAFRGMNNLISFPRVIGHEIAGEVVYLPKANPKGFKVGDRVVVDPYLYCGHCYACSVGRTNCCENLKVLGVHIDGGMSEYFAHPASMLIHIPEDMGWGLAAMAEPLTISLHGIHRSGLIEKEHILIFGAGPIGLLAALVARSYGSIPIVSDPVDARLDMAREIGIPFTINPVKEILVEKVREYCGGRLAEVVMDASGSNVAIRSSLDCVCNAGRVILTGWPKGDTLMPTEIFTRKELDIRGARTSEGEFPEALELIRLKRKLMESLLTKMVGIDEVPQTIIDIEKSPSSYLKVVVMI